MKIYEYQLKAICVREDAPYAQCSSVAQVVEYMKGAFDERPEQEQIWILHLNRKNMVKGRQLLTIGTQNGCMADPALVLRAALLANASAFILVHNHPSGDPAPSVNDNMFTRAIRDAAKVVNVQFLDHVVIGDVRSDPMGKGHFSFRDSGMI